MTKLGSWKWVLVVFVLPICMSLAGAAQQFYEAVEFGGPNGGNPVYGPLAQATDGSFYGTTQYGGNYGCGSVLGCGTVFKVTAEGKLTTLYSFCSQPNCADGASPWAGLILATDGNFYGTTYLGGAHCAIPLGLCGT